MENFEFAPSHLEPSLGEAILQSKAVHGISNTAMAILEHGDLKEEIKRILYKESHHNIKDNLKKSKLCANKNDRQFLLSLSPKSLCQEFQQNSPHTFLHLVTGILGISDPNSVFENQFLLNNICQATLLNRKEAKTAKGKNAIDELKEFYLLKSDARFVQYFINKFDIDTDKDNTPDNLKTATKEAKTEYLHGLVADCLRDLIPFFKDTKVNNEVLLDHPLQRGTRISRQTTSTAVLRDIPEQMEAPNIVSQADAEAAVENVNVNLSKETIISKYLDVKIVDMSSKRTKQVFFCVLCQFESKYKTVCANHIENCITKLPNNDAAGNDEEVTGGAHGPAEVTGPLDSAACDDKEITEAEELPDMFFNYKNAEFFLDSIFAVTTIFEKYGDRVGCLIVSKIFLPIFHALHHSNYSCSVHRYITRVLSEASPREALKLVHERFSNRSGKPGKNVFRDRRMEFRIGIIKKLIGNLGPNFSDESVKQVNHMVDIKEELYNTTRLSHGVTIRSGRHVSRSDVKDFQLLVDNLTKIEAHIVKPGRKFGSFEYPPDIMNDAKFDKAQFYRWICQKNKEARNVD